MFTIIVSIFFIHLPLSFGCPSDIDGIDWRELFGPFVYAINGLRYGNQTVTFTLNTNPPTNWAYYDNPDQVFYNYGTDLPAQEQSSNDANMNAQWAMMAVLRDSIRDAKATSYGGNITVSYTPFMTRGCSRFAADPTDTAANSMTLTYVDFYVTGTGHANNVGTCSNANPVAPNVFWTLQEAARVIDDSNPKVELTMIVTRVDWNSTTLRRIVTGMLNKLKVLKLIPDAASTETITTRVV
uniref:Glyco_hydro_18 domain-containing protein n=1 Tax=Parastrongyloides trichosuri TaxID=131310 RepID=A0A0N4ZM27_PARTI